MSGRRRDITPEMEASLIAAGKELRALGRSWSSVEKQLGVGVEWLRRRLDPGYSDKSNHESSARLCDHRVNGRWERELETGLRNIVILADTRNYTQRFCGDPIFERSALFQKMKGGAP